MVQIDKSKKRILLEALEELMYKTALELESLKGQPMTKRRKELTKKQFEIERIQREIIMIKSKP